MPQILTDWTRKLACLVGQHDWKRAMRISDRRGTQVCKRCGARRECVLRAVPTAKQPPAP